MKPALVWDEWNIDHIKKHKVSVQEVEEAYQCPLFKTKAKAGRTLLIAKLKKRSHGNSLFVISKTNTTLSRERERFK